MFQNPEHPMRPKMLSAVSMSDRFRQEKMRKPSDDDVAAEWVMLDADMDAKVTEEDAPTSQWKCASATEEDEWVVISKSDIKTDILPDVHVSLIKAEDVAAAFDIEKNGYPEDEAASHEGLIYRQKEAGDFFYGAYKVDKLVGYVCATRCAGFDHDSLSVHDPAGPILAVHSVCVDKPYQKQGIARAMLKKYVELISLEEGNGVTSIMLMAKQHLIKFYVSCGFTCEGLSAIVHGQDPWFDFNLDLTAKRRPPFYVVDAFTNKAGSGNPAAVVMLHPDSKASEDSDWMQLIAKEFNLSETVYVIPLGSGYRLFYFTPTCEIPLCGHATLAAAAVLFKNGANPQCPIKVHPRIPYPNPNPNPNP